jgi:hypothetical protein
MPLSVSVEVKVGSREERTPACSRQYQGMMKMMKAMTAGKRNFFPDTSVRVFSQAENSGGK